jgi:hypothetical protein
MLGSIRRALFRKRPGFRRFAPIGLVPQAKSIPDFCEGQATEILAEMLLRCHLIVTLPCSIWLHRVALLLVA